MNKVESSNPQQIHCKRVYRKRDRERERERKRERGEVAYIGTLNIKDIIDILYIIEIKALCITEGELPQFLVVS